MNASVLVLKLGRSFLQRPNTVHTAEVEKRHLEIKEWRKRSKKAATLVTQIVDDSIVMSLDVHGKNPVLIVMRHTGV